jgi:hypothetical protein
VGLARQVQVVELATLDQFADVAGRIAAEDQQVPLVVGAHEHIARDRLQRGERPAGPGDIAQHAIAHADRPGAIRRVAVGAGIVAEGQAAHLECRRRRRDRHILHAGHLPGAVLFHERRQRLVAHHQLLSEDRLALVLLHLEQRGIAVSPCLRPAQFDAAGEAGGEHLQRGDRILLVLDAAELVDQHGIVGQRPLPDRLVAPRNRVDPGLGDRHQFVA